MKSPVDEQLNYSLRPSKNIERKMLAEIIQKLDRLAPLSTFRYIGFGSRFFNDFTLYHRALGIGNMISIEKEVEKKQRFLVNKPLRSIHMMWGRASEVLPQLSWRRRAIVWLDYESGLTEEVLRDISTVMASAKPGSLMFVTVNVHPAPARLMAGRGTHDYSPRLEKLQSDLGNDAFKIPADVTPHTLHKKWAVSSVVRRMIANEAQAAILSRNAAADASKHVHYQQVAYFNYADGACMLTTGGLLVGEREMEKLGGSFEKLEFYRPTEEPYLIEPPVLTDRERQVLDRRLPDVAAAGAGPDWLSSDDWDRYKRVYRYFPAFVEAER